MMCITNVANTCHSIMRLGDYHDGKWLNRTSWYFLDTQTQGMNMQGQNWSCFFFYMSIYCVWTIFVKSASYGYEITVFHALILWRLSDIFSNNSEKLKTVPYGKDSPLLNYFDYWRLSLVWLLCAHFWLYSQIKPVIVSKMGVLFTVIWSDTVPA